MVNKKTSASANTRPNQAKLGQKSEKETRYNVEIMFSYYASAGGNLQKAMRLAKQAKDDRVPKHKDTWAKYTREHKFAERLKAQEEDLRADLRAKLMEKHEQALSDVGEAFQAFAAVFKELLLEDIGAMRAGNKGAKARMRKLCTAMDYIDRFFRMYFRAIGLPERITEQNTNFKQQDALSYDEIEQEDATCESLEEARKQIPSAIQT